MSISPDHLRNLDVKIEKPWKEIADRFIEEARIMSKFDHPHIIRLIGVCTDRSPIFIVMELCEKGSLREYLQKNENYFDQQNLHLIRYVKQLASALSYLESQSFVHRYDELEVTQV